MNDFWASFNLVIEVLLFSTKSTRHLQADAHTSFNLVIEVLLFSTFPWQNSHAIIGIPFSFNLVIEVLLFSTH